MISKRNFLIGCGTAILSSALPAIPGDPLVKRVIYQSWPFSEPRPEVDWYEGSIVSANGEPRRLSSLLKPHMTYWKVA